VQVLVEPGAGTAAWFGDDDYEQAGAQIVGLDELVARADVLVTVGEPPPS
jgi:NAD(P) transhydrogenase subunit alpha